MDIERRWLLPSEPDSVGRARTALRGFVDRTCGDVDDLDAAVLLVSELVSNAVLHAGGGGGGGPPVGLLLRLRDDCLRIEVTDHDPRPPVPRSSGPRDDGGRGLLLVDRLASEWGWTVQRKPGKRVWCDVPRHRRPPPSRAGVPPTGPAPKRPAGRAR